MKNYSSDAPITDKKHDRFNRFPFSERIANVISERNDPSSIVIGINGKWGDGKTTVLNFIGEELKEKENVVCFKFNPWRFGDEDQMLINFFNDLARAIDRSMETRKEKLGDFIQNYIKPTADIAGKGEAVEGIRSFLSVEDIEKLKDRIERLLWEEEKRVVILVDDIDRLDKNEIHAVFRLVKLTADFSYTAYVLAFDKQVVSVALQDRYGDDALGIGNSFLDKIIQVPLELPAIDDEELRNFCFKEIEQLLEFSEIKLTDENARKFTKNFTKSLERQLKTPRQVKLYSNILMFSLPILRNEVNVVDLMLIEGIRVFMPGVYALIRDNKELFLKGVDSGVGHRNSEDEKERRREIIEECIKEFTQEEKEEIKSLLRFLFPKLNSIFGNTIYNSESEAIWSEKQRICSPQYFQRYFTYGINAKDISDVTMNDLLEISKKQPVESVVSKINEVMTEKNMDIFISKLRRLSKKFTIEQSNNLAISIAQLGSSLPNPAQVFHMLNTYVQGAVFIGDCIENLEDKNKQIELAEKVIHNADSLSFALECFIWFRRDTEEYPNPKGFSKEDCEKLKKVLAIRISSELGHLQVIDIEKIEYLPDILSLWDEYGKEGEASQAIIQNINNNENFIFKLLDNYTPTVISEHGAKKSNFRRKDYDTIIKVVDPTIIKSAIEEVYGNLYIDEHYPEFPDVSRNEELARQFLWLHQNVQED